jgi:hypothetical protein
MTQYLTLLTLICATAINIGKQSQLYCDAGIAESSQNVLGIDSVAAVTSDHITNSI